MVADSRRLRVGIRAVYRAASRSEYSPDHEDTMGCGHLPCACAADQAGVGAGPCEAGTRRRPSAGDRTENAVGRSRPARDLHDRQLHRRAVRAPRAVWRSREAHRCRVRGARSSEPGTGGQGPRRAAGVEVRGRRSLQQRTAALARARHEAVACHVAGGRPAKRPAAAADARRAAAPGGEPRAILPPGRCRRISQLLRPLHHARRCQLDPPRHLRERHPHPAGPRLRRHPERDDPRDAGHSHRPQGPSAGKGHPSLHGRPARPLGGQHPGRRFDELHRPNRRGRWHGRELEPAPCREVHAHRARYHSLRVHGRRPGDVLGTMDGRARSGREAGLRDLRIRVPRRELRSAQHAERIACGR